MWIIIIFVMDAKSRTFLFSGIAVSVWIEKPAAVIDQSRGKSSRNCCAQFVFSSVISASARNRLLVYWNVCSTTDSWRVILSSCFFLVDWHQAKRRLVFEIDQTLASILFNSLYHIFSSMSFTSNVVVIFRDRLRMPMNQVNNACTWTLEP